MYLSYIPGLKRKGDWEGKMIFNICITFWNMLVVFTCSVGDYTSWCWWKVTPVGPVGARSPLHPYSCIVVLLLGLGLYSVLWMMSSAILEPNRGQESVRQFPSVILEALLLLMESSGSEFAVDGILFIFNFGLGFSFVPLRWGIVI